MTRILRALFVVYVAATAVHVGWVVAHEPFVFDAWNVARDTHAAPITLDRFFDYWGFEYLHSNPRLGQPLTYLAYKLDTFAVIATPLALVALSLAVVVLGLGRWPWRRDRDLALWAIAIGCAWFALPHVGKTLFCRAYSANYVYATAIQLWFLVPLRLAAPGARGSPVANSAYALLGLAAGACSEHTGPALCAFALGYAAWLYRSGANRRAYLAWSGALGAVVGFALIFFAPGQGERYDNLAQKTSLFGRLAQRWIAGDLDIVGELVLSAAPLLGLIVLAIALGGDPVDDAARAARRRALRFVVLALAGGLVVAVTLFVSPKRIDSRFFIAPMAVLLAAFVAVADTTLATRRLVAPFVALAIAASSYAALRTVKLFPRLARESDARIAALEASRPGAVVTVDAFDQVEPSWWFLGDDFRDIKKRELVTAYFDLAGVVFRAFDQEAPLGVTDVRLVPRFHPTACLDLPLGTYRGSDVASIQHAMVTAVDLLRARSDARFDRIELAVEFAGDRPALPRTELLVARWRPRGFEGWTATIARPTRARTREVVVPAALPRDFEIFVYQVGGEARRLGTASDALRFEPWKTGAYWVLACRADECFVISASRQAA